VNTQSYSQWYEKNNGLPTNWGAIVLDAYDSLIAGGPMIEDSLYITTDGSNTWYSIPNPSFIYDISIMGSDIIWFSNIIGEIYATTDGGLNWQFQFYDPSKTEFMNYIEMFDSFNGIAMGDAPSFDKPALFLKTTDGGANWISQNDSALFGLLSPSIWRGVDFVDVNTGYFFSSGESPQKLYKTENSGKDWVVVNDSITCDVIKFYNEDLGLCKGEYCPSSVCIEGFFRTLDGGTNWEMIKPDNYMGYGMDIEFLPDNPSDVWFIVHGRAFFSSDTGKTWIEQFSLPNYRFWHIVFTDKDHGWLLTEERGIGGKSHIFYTSNGGFGGIVNIDEENEIPKKFNLSQNYPNPFNPITTIRYSIPSVTMSGVEGSLVTLLVYDILGKEIATLVNENKQAGNYSVEFNAPSLASGIYIYRLTSGQFSISKKLILLK
jgi:photosystem II stability/assembly factor-like uncharacterized protein